MLYTVGHSTRPIDELLGLLHEHAVASVVDVRRFPGSRRHPQYSQEALKASLAGLGIAYLHKVELGGRRSLRAGSLNTAWRNASFRAYADHMDSAEFRDALAELIDHASRRRTAIMCAEVLPHRCHRRLIADALVARGIDVIHILARGRTEPHVLNPQARILEDGRLRYVAQSEPAQQELFPAERVSSLT
ncbi:MAG: DUF488 domain-containing protein [Polyangiaceae bacterium]|nr:DUF488 domain-containing protein [Polyangiaceae bacterium]